MLVTGEARVNYQSEYLGYGKERFLFCSFIYLFISFFPFLVFS